MHFQSDGKWLLRQGFREVETLETDFSLLVKDAEGAVACELPSFAESARKDLDPDTNGVTEYYSNRCPFTDFHIKTSLKETCKKRNLLLTVIKLDSLEPAQNAPSPATILASS